MFTHRNSFISNNQISRPTPFNCDVSICNNISNHLCSHFWQKEPCYAGMRRKSFLTFILSLIEHKYNTPFWDRRINWPWQMLGTQLHSSAVCSGLCPGLLMSSHFRTSPSEVPRQTLLASNLFRLCLEPSLSSRFHVVPARC